MYKMSHFSSRHFSSRRFFPPAISHYIYVGLASIVIAHLKTHICNLITLSHGFHRSTNPQGGGGALCLELPLPAGLLCPCRLDAESRRRACSSCTSRCGAPDVHHEPLLLRAHAGAAEESQIASRLFPYLGSLLRGSA